MRTKEGMQAELEQKRERLELYLEREKIMLSADGVKSYGVGSRNLQRYDTALADIQSMIGKLQKEIAELEGLVTGRKPRKAVGVVIRDW